MDKKWIIWIVIILVIVVGGAIFYLYRGTFYSPSTGNSGQNVSTNKVSIQNFNFNPENITVKAGTTVTWTNDDSVTHHIKADDSSFESKDLNNGDTYSFTFSKTGVYKYHCSIHPSMTGSVVVD
jgi:plastocyanin